MTLHARCLLTALSLFLLCVRPHEALGGTRAPTSRDVRAKVHELFRNLEISDQVLEVALGEEHEGIPYLTWFGAVVAVDEFASNIEKKQPGDNLGLAVSLSGGALEVRKVLRSTSFPGIVGIAEAMWAPFAFFLTHEVAAANENATRNQLEKYLAARECGCTHLEILDPVDMSCSANRDVVFEIVAGEKWIFDPGCGPATAKFRTPFTKAAEVFAVGNAYVTASSEDARAEYQASVEALKTSFRPLLDNTQPAPSFWRVQLKAFFDLFGRLLAEGSIQPRDPLAIDPKNQEVAFTLGDSFGTRYEAVVPSGQFTETKAGGVFRFVDELGTAANGLSSMVITRKKGDSFKVTAKAEAPGLAFLLEPVLTVGLTVGSESFEVTLPVENQVNPPCGAKDRAVTFVDGDQDGFGDPLSSTLSCGVRPNEVLVGGDCRDTDEAIHPGATELCSDNADNDCNGDSDCDDAACQTDPSCIVPLPGSSASIRLKRSSEEYLSAPDSGALSETGSLTLEAWVNLASEPALAERYAILSKGGVDDGYALAYVHDIPFYRQIQFSIAAPGGPPGIASFPVFLPTGAWRHIAVVYDAAAGTARLYVDGSSDAGLVTGLPIAIEDNADDLRIGALGDGAGGAGDFFDGEIDEVRVWPFARLQHQIEWTRNRELVSSERTATVGYWRLNADFVDGAGRGIPLLSSGEPRFTADTPVGRGFGSLNSYCIDAPPRVILDWSYSYLIGPIPLEYEVVRDGASIARFPPRSDPRQAAYHDFDVDTGQAHVYQVRAHYEDAELLESDVTEIAVGDDCPLLSPNSLSVIRSGQGRVVADSPGSIDCGPICSDSFPDPDPTGQGGVPAVYLKATADPGWHLTQLEFSFENHTTRLCEIRFLRSGPVTTFTCGFGVSQPGTVTYTFEPLS